MRIHADEGEDMNALLMVVIASILAMLLGMEGISIGVQAPEGMQGLPIVTNFLLEILVAFVLSWSTSKSLRLFGVKEHAGSILRLVGITRAWVILGYLIMFFTPYGIYAHAIALLQLAYFIGQTTKVNMPVALLAIVLGVVLTFAIFIFMFIGLAFFLMITIF